MALSLDKSLHAATRTSHVATCRAVATSPSGQQLTLPLLGGSVTVDATSSVRRTVQLNVAAVDSSILPLSASHPLAPFGSEVTVYKGLVDPATGTSYEIQQGVFRINSVDLSADDGGVTISVTGADRASQVSSLTVDKTVTLNTGLTIGGAINQIMDGLSSVKSYARALESSSYTIGTRYMLTGDDPWQHIQELAMAAGQEAFFDTSGTLTTKSIPSLAGSTQATFTYLEDATNVVMNMSRTLDGSNVVNGVILVGASGVRGETYDSDTLSPTVYNGPYGKKPVRIDCNYVMTAAQASAVSAKLFNGLVGQPITLSMIPNPALDVRDVLQVQSSFLNVSTKIMVDQITLPLEPDGLMQVTGRARYL